MADNDQQAQGQGASTESAHETSSQSSQQTSTEQGNETRVPKHRFDEVNKRMKDAETALKQLQEEKEQQQEERATKQGEYQELANKRQKKIEKLEQDLKQVQGDWTRERRMNIWSRAAQGVVKPEAIADAFSFLSEEELSSSDETDEAAFKQLAQNLVEVKPYLAAEGPRGAGSGGSRTPVMVGENSTSKVGGKQALFKGQRRKSWK